MNPIQELVRQNLEGAPPADPPIEPIPDESAPEPEIPMDDGPGLEELLDEPESEEPQGMSLEDARMEARAFLRSQGEIVGSPQEVAQIVANFRDHGTAQAPEAAPDPMAELNALTQGLKPYQGEGDFDEQAAYIAAQVAQRSTEQTMSQIMEQVKAELSQALAPIMQAVQTAQSSQAEQEVRADLRSIGLDDQAVDATLQMMQKMGPQAVQTYLVQDTFREAMQGYGLGKKKSTRAEELSRRQAAPPVDALPATRDSGAAAPAKAPTTIAEAVRMAAADPSYGKN